ncbi:MAG: hypothetical protein JSS79_10420 [Bacteroidetes bacterium]|nr:hypothetical protein [Bacteroidota bacterium]
MTEQVAKIIPYGHLFWLLSPQRHIHERWRQAFIGQMHLSKEIQGRLNKLNSGLTLSTTIDGTSPDTYSFYKNLGRSFRTEFAGSDKQFSIVLFERDNKQKHENCFARGLFSDLDRLTGTIKRWVVDQDNINEVKSDYEELELYSDFDFKNENLEIEKAWDKVKNMFFNNTEFWKQPEWNNRYLEMLTAAKNHQAFQNYFPFTSHYWLRFSIDKDIQETWTLDTYIIPTMYSKEIPKSSGKFYVSYNDKPLGGQFFNHIKDALDFYADKLREKEPTKWVTEK